MLRHHLAWTTAMEVYCYIVRKKHQMSKENTSDGDAEDDHADDALATPRSRSPSPSPPSRVTSFDATMQAAGLVPSYNVRHVTFMLHS